MNSVDYHRQYFRSLWREKVNKDKFARVEFASEKKLIDPPVKKESKFCKEFRRFRQQFVREVRIMCSPKQQKEIRRKIKQKKRAEKIQR